MPASIILPDPSVEALAREIAGQITRRPDLRRLRPLMGDALLARHTPRELRKVLARYHRQCGECVEVQPLAVPVPNWGRFELRFSRGWRASLDVTVDPGATRQASGVTLGTPVQRRTDVRDIARAIDALPGRTAWQLAHLDGDQVRVLAGARKNTPLAVGSASKLYILGTLVRATLRDNVAWTETLPLQASCTAIPTGQLQTWPLGTPLTLQSLACMMISLSDNTATDHLLARLGREHIEQFQAHAGHARPELNMPFLSIMELMAIKGAPDDVVRRYVRAEPAERRQMLEALGTPSRASVFVSQTPRQVDGVEWFASPADLCRCLHWFLRSGGEIGRDVLRINPGMEIPPRPWPYVGFKGGSEPGVVSAAYLLCDAEDAWYALSVTWNRDDGPTDEPRFFGIVRDLIDLAPALRKPAPPPRPSFWRRILRLG